MDKQTLSNYGWLVIVTLILAVMLALATPFGTYVGDAVVNIANGYVQSSNNAMDDDNIKANSEKFDNKFDYGAWEEPIYGTNNPKLNHSGTIPTGGEYYSRSTLRWHNAGETFPEICDGDVYYYGDYMYCYGYYWCTSCVDWTYDCGCGEGSSGWQVRVKDDSKTKYEDNILESVNNENTTSFWNAFMYCTNLIDASNIHIPSTVWDFEDAFSCCSSLTKIPEFKDLIGVPSSQEVYLGSTFYNCESLSGTIVIDITNISDIGGCFRHTNVTAIKMSNGQTHPMEADLLNTK